MNDGYAMKLSKNLMRKTSVMCTISIVQIDGGSRFEDVSLVED